MDLLDFFVICKKNLINKVYLIIPLICFTIWALSSLLKDNFILLATDFSSFYYAAKYDDDHRLFYRHRPDYCPSLFDTNHRHGTSRYENR